MKKPKIGIMPKWLHDHNRFNEIHTLIQKRLSASQTISIEWITEYNELVNSGMKKR